MKVLIIGGTGFISSHLTNILLNEGHDVTILTRGRNSLPDNRHVHLRNITGDRRDSSFLKEIAEKGSYDSVFDMVAYHPKDSEHAVNAFGGKTGRFIHCSTISVYMISDDLQCPITEDQWTRPVMEYWERNPFGMDYGIKKRRCEEVLWESHERGKLNVSVIRPTYVCGQNDLSKRDFFWIQRILDGKPLLVPGSGDCAFQNVYVKDVARAFANLLLNENTVGQAYNITAEEIFSLNDYIRAIAKLMDKEVELVHLDQRAFDALPFSTNQYGDVFPFNVRRTAVFSLDKAKRDLHYKSTPFSLWMSETINWYLNEFKGNSFGYERREQELEVVSRIQSNLLETK